LSQYAEEPLIGGTADRAECVLFAFAQCFGRNTQLREYDGAKADALVRSSELT
jgi:hypothetical protein